MTRTNNAICHPGTPTFLPFCAVLARVAVTLMLSFVFALLYGTPASGQSKSKPSIKSEKKKPAKKNRKPSKKVRAPRVIPVVISPAAPSYLVLKDVNIRALPKTSSKRVGRLKKGGFVQSKGRARGTEWINVPVAGREKTGFVYGSALAAVIDGRLKNVIKGNITRAGSPSCRYRIHFEGKNEIVGEFQRTSDYQAPFQCDYKAVTVKFTASMFLTELPYQDYRKEVYQLNVDVVGLPLEEEDVLSVVILYHPRKNIITFDSLNDKSMGSGKKISAVKAETVAKALVGAMDIAHQAWGNNFWTALAEKK